MQILELFLLLGQGNRGVIIEPLGHELERQRVLLAGGLFDLRALILEPNFYLGLVQAQLAAELLPPPLGQVAVFGKLVLQPGQLRPRKGRSGALFLGRRRRDAFGAARFFHTAGSRTWNRMEELN